MAKCEICGKGAHFGNNVSHSHRRSNHMWKSNIKHVTAKINGANKKIQNADICVKPAGLNLPVSFFQPNTLPGQYRAILYGCPLPRIIPPAAMLRMSGPSLLLHPSLPFPEGCPVSFCQA